MHDAHPSLAPEHVRKLVLIGQCALVSAAGWFLYHSSWEDPLLTFGTLAMLVLGTLPMIRWLARNDLSYPIIELLLLTTVPFYAMPILTGHEELAYFPESVLLKATFVVLTFQAACLLGARWVAGLRRNPPASGNRWHKEILPEARMQFTAYTSALNTLWLAVESFTDFLPKDLNGTLRAIFAGIGIISIFVQARLWGDGKLSAGQKVFFWINLLAQIILTLVSLLLINGIGLLFTALVGYFTTARRVPWLPVLVLLPVIAILQNGKTAMRSIYWNDGIADQKVASLPEYFTQWMSLGIQGTDSKASGSSPALTHNLMRRASLFQIVCVTVNTIPHNAPYLEGESYLLLPAQFIPRFLWPDKPSPHRSVSLMSTQLGLLTQAETETTSIGFGMLTEAYANFGYIAVGLLGFCFGCSFRWLSLSTLDSPTFSPAGLVRILCLVWCISAETTLAVWLSSFYQACIAILIPVWLLRPLLASATSSSES